MTTVIATIFVLFLIIAFVYEANRKSQSSVRTSSPAQKPGGEENLLTADEAMPTQTGRFRAHQVLQQPAGESRQPAAAAADPETVIPAPGDEEAPLPDPFFDNKK
ncbi:MAG TPA: hypothetical protein PLP17_00025 [Oligoflexia bacterium]|nr:hypothetical protein [Oligoflexia bacterium]